ncbi:hypothetical protein [Teredinibacter turnerae]|uniref:hypothetical protein n=1 Tax=Teredinibacter turnerae TaxID=2426 RepID=UPI00048CAE30|nr:hypothetical protein [Teredinibacter turnerae]
MPTKSVQQYWVNACESGSQGSGLGAGDGLGDGLGLGEGVGLGDGVGLGEGNGLATAVGVGVGVILAPGVGVGDGEVSGVGVIEGVAVGIGVTEGVVVGVGEILGSGVGNAGPPVPGSVKPLLPPPHPAIPQQAITNICATIGRIKPITFKSITTKALLKNRQIKCRRCCAKTL